MPDVGRAPRADAVRNRRRIMDAAREQITSVGPGVGMDVIAQAAGVAVGTLYRHFPTKTDLVRAVVGEYTIAVADDAEQVDARVRGGADAGAELVAFLTRVVNGSATNHAVKAAASSLNVTHHGDQDAESRAATALASVIAIGQQTGTINPAVTVDDVYLLITTAPTDQPQSVRDRWFSLILPGLVPPSR